MTMENDVVLVTDAGSGIGRGGEAQAFHEGITVHGTTAITTWPQEMHIVFDEDLPPFPVQEAVTRVWEETAEGRRLAHLHEAERMPPA
ncbi:hypothetical protein ACIBVL_41735 [Streptomyces sp. NPDC049687]|uniref:hypothetical protein n=1 Tax=Streptomyces sp. NPDC049687 TaxID=3365596 RepID=UPI0037BD4245